MSGPARILPQPAVDMKASLFETPTLASLKTALDETTLQQRVTAHNLANVETEGFVPHRLEFRHQLEAALAVPPITLTRTHPAHLLPQPSPASTPPGAVLTATPGRGIEDFLVDLIESSYQYQASAKLLTGQYGLLHESIRGRTS